MISSCQLVINDNTEHPQAGHALNAFARWWRRADPASRENDLLSLCVVHLQIVAGRPSLYAFNLRIAHASVDGRYNQVSVISEFENSVSFMDRMKVGCRYDI